MADSSNGNFAAQSSFQHKIKFTSTNNKILNRVVRYEKDTTFGLSEMPVTRPTVWTALALFRV